MRKKKSCALTALDFFALFVPFCGYPLWLSAIGYRSCEARSVICHLLFVICHGLRRAIREAHALGAPILAAL